MAAPAGAAVMRVLLVEDQDNDAAILEGGIAEHPRVVTCDRARTKVAAIELLGEREFDLIVCDLGIPAAEGELAEAEHGKSVVSYVRGEGAPGTPVIVLTGALEPRELYREHRNLMEQSESADYLGEGRHRQLVECYDKEDFQECIDRIKELATGLDRLDDILITGMLTKDLGYFGCRVVRLHASGFDGKVVNVVPLTGGLSGSTVARVKVLDAGHKPHAFAVAKIDRLRETLSEEGRCAQFVAPRLGPGAFVPTVGAIKCGAGQTGACFYSDAKGHEESLFETLKRDQTQAVAVVQAIREVEAPWREGSSNKNITVRSLRESLCNDDVLELRSDLLAEVNYAAFEAREVNVRECVQHRDLHGGNILVRPSDAAPLVIDYGMVEPSSIACDPVALELSLLFHPAAAELRGTWPSVDQARQWVDNAKFAAGSGLEEFIAECRAWANSESVSQREVCAVAYSYAMRNLRYEDTDHDLCIAIAEAAIAGFADEYS